MARPSSPHKKPKGALGEDTTTPLMRQYYDAKKKHPDAILLFRIGDFYETFGQDAITASSVLGITLTNRNNGSADTELAGFPYHSVDNYLPKLVRAGYRVAICEQLEKPVAGRVVKRGVVEVITPGVTSDDKILDQHKNNYLAVIAIQKDYIGVSFLDISTGEFLVTEGDWAYVEKLFQTFEPKEVLYSKAHKEDINEHFRDSLYTYALEDWVYKADYGREKLLEHFKVNSLKGFGIEEMTLAQSAAGVALHYLATTENTHLKHINHISRLNQDKYVWLDRFTIRNLELIQPTHENGRSLLNVLDKTMSPMGARLMKKWVVLPLKDQAAIEQRLKAVAYFMDNPEKKAEFEGFIKQIGDLERLISKVPLGKINPREVRQLARALRTITPIKNIFSEQTDPIDIAFNSYLKKLAESLNPCEDICFKIENVIVPDPPVNLAKGNVIADDADVELGDLRHIIHHSQALLGKIQQQEIDKTGISSLKVGFNSVFGYYLEVTAKYKNIDIPKDWIRKQTLANAERYITPELKVLEEKILTAAEKMQLIEERLFQTLVGELLDYVKPIQQSASVIAVMDCLRSFATVALKQNYKKPVFTEGGYDIDIKGGRHAVIEQHLPIGEVYVPNDVFLDKDTQQILMITGPNMAGKSALLRQTALICLMAQMGSFVPADSAVLGILDKVFTRVGASDNLSSGESTFMVEMNETASIMNNISDRSLILLDEIGRGTSTYDGISIAWSIAEYLNDSEMRPKTLFATHYHELNELADNFPRIKNYHVATKELGQRVIFLRKLTEGGSEHSFGVHVARMAGMPNSIIDRANDILSQLEQKHIDIETTIGDEDGVQTEKYDVVVKNTPLSIETKNVLKTKVKNLQKEMQMTIFDISDPRLQRIKEALDKIDLNNTTPIELMMHVANWQKMLADTV